MGEHFLWLCGDEWRLVEVYFGWVGICGHFLYVDADRWDCILGG